MSELNQSQLETALRDALPPDLQGHAGELAAAVLRAAKHGVTSNADLSLLSPLQELGGRQLQVGGSLISFGEGNQFGDVSIGDVAGGHLVKLTLNLPRAPWRIPEDAIDACPYLGLAVFGADDAPYFFGRDADIPPWCATQPAPL